MSRYTFSFLPASEENYPGEKVVDEAPAMFFVATQDTTTGIVYLNVVNTTSTAQPVNIAMNGLKRVNASGKVTVLQGNKPEDTNSITEPKKIVPVTTSIKGVSSHFTRTVPPYSISIFQFYK